MASFAEARDRILEQIRPLDPIELPLLEAHGCVLATDVVAEYDVPPFAEAAVEGFAVRAADLHAADPGAGVTLRVAGAAAEDGPSRATVGWGEAVRVSEGDPLPAGADCIVTGEDAGDVVVVTETVAEGTGVLPAGREVRSGDVLVPAGRRLSGPELAVLASVGRGAPPAFPKVRVGVVTAADVVEPGRSAHLGRPRDAASFQVAGALREAGAAPYRLAPVAPQPEVFRDAMLANLVRADCFIAVLGTGDALDPGLVSAVEGLSVLDAAMHPGREVAFGLVEGTPVFAVPGAPASAFVSFEILVRPAILRMMGRRDTARPEVRAVLDGAVGGPAGHAIFAPALVERHEGVWRARPTAGGPQHGLAGANGLIAVPPGNAEAGEGEEVPVRLFRSLDR